MVVEARRLACEAIKVGENPLCTRRSTKKGYPQIARISADWGRGCQRMGQRSNGWRVFHLNLREQHAGRSVTQASHSPRRLVLDPGVGTAPALSAGYAPRGAARRAGKRNAAT